MVSRKYELPIQTVSTTSQELEGNSPIYPHVPPCGHSPRCCWGYSHPPAPQVSHPNSGHLSHQPSASSQGWTVPRVRLQAVWRRLSCHHWRRCLRREGAAWSGIKLRRWNRACPSGLLSGALSSRSKVRCWQEPLSELWSSQYRLTSVVTRYVDANHICQLVLVPMVNLMSFNEHRTMSGDMVNPAHLAFTTGASSQSVAHRNHRGPLREGARSEVIRPAQA